MLPFRHNSPPSTGEMELVQPWSKPAWLPSKRWQTGWDEGEHSTLPAAPATFLARWGWGRKEGLSLLPSIRLWFSWQLPGACSAALDWAREPKGQFLLRTNVDQGCIHKLGGYTKQNHWKIIWTILLGISPHTVSWLIPCQLHNKRKQGRAWVRQPAVRLRTHRKTLLHTVTINPHLYSRKEPSHLWLLLKKPTNVHRKHQAETA